MRPVWTAAVVLLAACVFAMGLQADDQGDKKEVTLKGTILCAKCALKEAKKCLTVIQVKHGDKSINYYFDDKGHKEEYHEAVCGGERKHGTVTGVVSKKDGKHWIKPSKVEYAKK